MQGFLITQKNNTHSTVLLHIKMTLLFGKDFTFTSTNLLKKRSQFYMEKEQLIKEIADLADQIKSNASANPPSLTTDAANLYEKIILLKYFPETKKEAVPLHPEPIINKKAESIKQEEIQAPVDLFSQETPIVQKPIATSEIKRETKKKVDESMADKLTHQKKISDLKSAIGINEKFQFINELFDGNMKEYNTAIEQLNTLTSLAQTENLLSSLKESYKWQPGNTAARNLTELVQRRFV